MNKAGKDLITLAVVLCPALLALLLSSFLPDSSESSLGLGLFGVVCTGITIVAGFIFEQQAKRTGKSAEYALTRTAAVAGFFCLWLVLGFITNKR